MPRLLLLALVLVAGCGGGEAVDGLGRVTGSVMGPPVAGGMQVDLRLEGPQELTLQVRTGEDFDVSLPPGSYRVSVDRDRQGPACPDRVEVAAGELRRIDLVWPVVPPCPDNGPPPAPPAAPPPEAPSY